MFDERKRGLFVAFVGLGNIAIVIIIVVVTFVETMKGRTFAPGGIVNIFIVIVIFRTFDKMMTRCMTAPARAGYRIPGPLYNLSVRAPPGRGP